MSEPLRGIFAPVGTVFDASGELDLDGMKAAMDLAGCPGERREESAVGKKGGMWRENQRDSSSLRVPE